MTLGTILTIIVGAIVIAMPLAIVIDHARRKWKHRPIWKAIEAPGDGFKLHERPDNVMALARKTKQSER